MVMKYDNLEWMIEECVNNAFDDSTEFMISCAHERSFGDPSVTDMLEELLAPLGVFQIGPVVSKFDILRALVVGDFKITDSEGWIWIDGVFVEREVFESMLAEWENARVNQGRER
jgi:hypothetical protein